MSREQNSHQLKPSFKTHRGRKPCFKHTSVSQDQHASAPKHWITVELSESATSGCDPMIPRWSSRSVSAALIFVQAVLPHPGQTAFVSQTYYSSLFRLRFSFSISRFLPLESKLVLNWKFFPGQIRGDVGDTRSPRPGGSISVWPDAVHSLPVNHRHYVEGFDGETMRE